MTRPSKMATPSAPGALSGKVRPQMMLSDFMVADLDHLPETTAVTSRNRRRYQAVQGGRGASERQRAGGGFSSFIAPLTWIVRVTAGRIVHRLTFRCPKR